MPTIRLNDPTFIVRDKEQIKRIRDSIARPAKKASDFKYIWDDPTWAGNKNEEIHMVEEINKTTVPIFNLFDQLNAECPIGKAVNIWTTPSGYNACFDTYISLIITPILNRVMPIDDADPFIQTGITKNDHEVIEKIFIEFMTSNIRFERSDLMKKIMVAGNGHFNPTLIESVIDSFISDIIQEHMVSLKNKIELN